MFVAFDRDVRISLGVITLGAPDRLRGCLDALCTHVSRHDFTVAVVVNADTPDGAPPEVDAPAGVLVDPVRVNLGWSGGLHRARALTDAELLVWVQDDMVPEPGWLDALVDAADAHPKIGGFGSVRVDAEGRPVPPNAGSATPYDAVELWNDTDSTTEWPASEVTTHDWVTSTGFLTRAAAWDELGGTDPRFWPVTHGDKDYCTHLRCHGWDVALVAAARVRHAGAQSAPTSFRPSSRTGESRGSTTAGPRPWPSSRAGRPGTTAHPCADWQDSAASPLETVTGAEANRMVVPLSRELAEETRTAAHWHRVREEDLVRQVEHYQQAWQDTNAHAETLTAALADAIEQRDRARRRVRRLRGRLSRAEGASVPPPTWRSRVRGRLRGWTHDG